MRPPSDVVREDPRASRRTLLLVYLVALVPRLLFVAELSSSPQGDFLSLDTETHHQLALRVAEKGSTGESVFFRAPLYPYLLGLVYEIFGPGPLAPRLLQALFDACAAPLTFLLALRFLARPWALAAALAVAGSWTLVYFTGQLLLTSLIVSLDLALLLLLLWRGPERAAGTKSALAAGLLLGLSALARPTILIFLPAALFWLVWSASRPGSESDDPIRPVPLTSRLRPALVFLAGSVLVIAPVTLRNWNVGGDRVLISSQAGINFFIGNNPEASGRSARAPLTWEEISPELRTRFENNLWSERLSWISAVQVAESALGREDLLPSEISRFWFLRAVDFTIEDPAGCVALFARKLYYLLNAYEIPSNRDLEHFIAEGRVATLRALSLGLPSLFPAGLLIPLALTGVLLALRSWRKFLLLHLFVATYASGVLLFFVNARFRMPLLPVAVIFAAHALAEILRRWRGPDRLRALSAPLAILLLFALLSNSRLFDVRDPRTIASLRFNLGNHWLEGGLKPAAERAYREALAIFPELPPAELRLAELHFQRGELDEAETILERLLDSSPGLADVHLNLGTILLLRGQPAAALERVQAGLTLDPLSAEGHFNLARVYAALQDEARAIEEYERALALDPELWSAAFNLGNARFRQGDMERAASAYEIVTRLAPKQAQAHNNLGHALVGAGRPAAARQSFRAALRIEPGLSAARLELTRILEEDGQRWAALEELRELLRLDPEHAEATRLMESLEAERED